MQTSPATTSDRSSTWRGVFASVHPQNHAHLVGLLAKLEAIVDRSERSFIETGQALAQMQDGLYVWSGFDTFREYVETRFGMSRGRAYQLIDAAKLSTVVDIQNEAQARALAPLKDCDDGMHAIQGRA